MNHLRPFTHLFREHGMCIHGFGRGLRLVWRDCNPKERTAVHRAGFEAADGCNVLINLKRLAKISCPSHLISR
jgi:hypothetical protein